VPWSKTCDWFWNLGEEIHHRWAGAKEGWLMSRLNVHSLPQHDETPVTPSPLNASQPATKSWQPSRAPFAVLPSPSPSATGVDLSAEQAFDRLMVRVMLPMFAVGAMAVVLLWWVEVSEHRLSAVNHYAYPTMAVLFTTCMALLWRRPGTVRAVRWVGFLSVAITQLGDLAGELLQAGPLVGNYDAITLFTWLPLVYAVAFILLEGQAAFWSACVILLLITGGFAWRLASPTGHADDVALLFNVLASHAVFIVCLTGWLQMKRLLSRQHGVTQQLRVLAATDPLTGLANRRQALAELVGFIEPLPRVPPPVALLCDIDHFKRVNDQLGHEAGDQVLVEVAEALRRATRASDLVSRWGGEEFLIVLPGTPLPEAMDLAERLRQRVASTCARGAAAPMGGATLSIGVAAHRADESLTAWLRRTDEALYRAKDAGRNRVVLDPHGPLPGAALQAAPGNLGPHGPLPGACPPGGLAQRTGGAGSAHALV
jgi:diguanylate cyclase